MVQHNIKGILILYKNQKQICYSIQRCLFNYSRMVILTAGGGKSESVDPTIDAVSSTMGSTRGLLSELGSHPSDAAKVRYPRPDDPLLRPLSRGDELYVRMSRLEIMSSTPEKRLARDPALLRNRTWISVSVLCSRSDAR